MSDAPQKHTLMGGKLHIYRRQYSGQWQCSTYLAGRNYRVSTKSESLKHAKDFAEDWYLGLHGKLRSGEISNEKTFKDAAAQFEKEYQALTQGERHPRYVKAHSARIKLYLNPFFGGKRLSEVTSGQIQEYRLQRLSGTAKADEAGKTEGRAPARSTLHQEMVTLRQVLKTALRRGWLSHLPDLSAPYKASGKISHRAWFSPAEYKQFYTATRQAVREAQGRRRQAAVEQLHDYVLFMANTGLRPDEAARLQYRDVTIVDDQATGERILEIEVRGKRGTGYCKSTRGAVRPFERLTDRAKPKPADSLFPLDHRDYLNEVLRKEGLKLDREGQRRTAYSLRHTYICMRLMEGADIYQVAKNCRTSVEMIENFYAAHIKTNLNAAAINVRRA
jgi:integrase